MLWSDLRNHTQSRPENITSKMYVLTQRINQMIDSGKSCYCKCKAVLVLVQFPALGSMNCGVSNARVLAASHQKLAKKASDDRCPARGTSMRKTATANSWHWLKCRLTQSHTAFMRCKEQLHNHHLSPLQGCGCLLLLIMLCTASSCYTWSSKYPHQSHLHV